MNFSVLDFFLLSLLDRGSETPYDLQRGVGISLGASLPSLRRLVTGKLVSREEGRAATNRPRHVYRLTASGKQAARTAWKAQLNGNDSPTDLDSILRIADMAAHYGADKKKIRSFLRRSAEARSLLARQAGLQAEASTRPSERISYSGMRTRCDAARLAAEAEALHGLADLFRGTR